MKKAPHINRDTKTQLLQFLNRTIANPRNSAVRTAVLMRNFQERNGDRKKKLFDFGSSANHTTALCSLIARLPVPRASVQSENQNQQPSPNGLSSAWLVGLP